MTVSNTNTRQTYPGTGAQTDFAIPFDFTDEAVIKVYLIDKLGVYNLWTVGAEYVLVGAPATLVRAAVAPAADEFVQVIRVTPQVQSTNYSGTVFPPESVEESDDDIVRMIQEVNDDLAAAVIPAAPTTSEGIATFPDWAQPVLYLVDQAVVYLDRPYRCLVEHTSFSFETDFGNGNWELLTFAGEDGPQGDKGDLGAQGPTGATGAAGAAGGNGSDGIFSEIASQAEAQTGTNNTKGMTPLRSRESQTAWKAAVLDPIAVISDAKIQANVVSIADHEARISVLEAAGGAPKYVQWGIADNVAVPQELEGAFVSAALAKSARVTIEIAVSYTHLTLPTTPYV